MIGLLDQRMEAARAITVRADRRKAIGEVLHQARLLLNYGGQRKFLKWTRSHGFRATSSVYHYINVYKGAAVTQRCVYFVQAACGGPIKIGRAKDIEIRLKSLQSGNPELLVVLAVLWGSWHREERQLHQQFASAHLRGEWFRPTDELLACIKGIGPPNIEIGRGAPDVDRDDFGDAVKKCSRCDKILPVEHFGPGDGKYGRRGYCKTCYATRAREKRHALNPATRRHLSPSP